MATETALLQCIDSIRVNWSGLNSATIRSCHEALRELTASASVDEAWLAQLHEQRPATQELYRDASRGFVLLGHTEPSGGRFPPHDHGAGWVFYAVQHGASEMETYKSITSAQGETTLVSRGGFTLRAGESRVFLPGDVHSTRVVSEYLVQVRLTSCDFALERDSGRMIRYPDPEAPTPAVA